GLTNQTKRDEEETIRDNPLFGGRCGGDVRPAGGVQRCHGGAQAAHRPDQGTGLHASEGTKAILKKIDTPVKIRFYCTQADNATPETVFLRNYAQQVSDLLDEFKQVAGGKLTIQKFNPTPDSDAEDSAKLDGIEGQAISAEGEPFYLGLAISMLDESVALPFLSPSRERMLEYDVARAISQAITPQKPIVGLMSALPVLGEFNPMMMRMGQRGQEPWIVVNELKRDFTVKEVALGVDKIDDDIKVLVVIYPREISDGAQYAIDQFILRGG